MEASESNSSSNNNNSSNEAVPASTKKRAHGQVSVTLNVGGTNYCVATDTIMKYPDTMLGSLLSKRWNDKEKKESIFVDRDPVRFRYILDFYRDGSIVIPCTMSREEILREAEYFALPITLEQIQFDAGDLASLRSTVSKAEDEVIAKFKTEARKRVIVACAYEIAFIHIDKLRREPGSVHATNLTYKEMPEKSFAKALCPEVLDEPVFKDTIRGLVQQAGYSYNSAINRDSLTLYRQASP